MQLRTVILAAMMSYAGQCAKAQAIDNLQSYKNINADRYIRLNYENDFFTATDEYYTQGISLEVVSPAMKKNPLTWLLPAPKHWQSRYGLGIEHNGYTPTNTDNNEIRYGDRPFAGTLMLRTFQLSTDAAHKQRFSSALSTGVIGPLAGAGQMQRSIHKWLGNYTPHGWDNQVANDIVLNYQVNYEKQLLRYDKYLSFSANGLARFGTLSDKLGIGSTLMLGYFDNPFGNVKAGQFSIYAYDHPEVCAVGYDATLQGGVFDKDSPYTIAAGDISRITFQNRWGIVLRYRQINLEYFQTYLTKEFEGQHDHKWGGIQVAVGF